MEVFGIFEGGGPKAIAHIGALRAAEDCGVKFCGVAGTSAGAIIAALIAVGYEADDLYNPDNIPKGEFDFQFLDLLSDSKEERAVLWHDVRALLDDAKRTFKGSDIVQCWAKAPLFYLRNRRVLKRVVSNWGVFQTCHFQCVIERLLAAKVSRRTGADGTVAFRDIRKPLKVIATDLTAGRIKLFSTETTPDETVSSAVASSICMPLFFEPTSRHPLLVDGGLISNFPAWVFDEERKGNGASIPTLGFDLVECAREQALNSVMDLAANLFNTVMGGDRELELRAVDNLYVVPIRVSTCLWDFDMSPEKMDGAYWEGRRDAQAFFGRQTDIEFRPPRKIRTDRLAHDSVLADFSRNRKSAAALPSDGECAN